MNFTSSRPRPPLRNQTRQRTEWRGHGWWKGALGELQSEWRGVRGQKTRVRDAHSDDFDSHLDSNLLANPSPVLARLNIPAYPQFAFTATPQATQPLIGDDGRRSEDDQRLSGGLCHSQHCPQRSPLRCRYQTNRLKLDEGERRLH